MKRRLLMWILWPAFLSAALAELVVFAVVDPADLRFFGEQITVSAQAVYTVSFLIFWGVIALGASLALLLVSQPAEGVRPARRSPGWPR